MPMGRYASGPDNPLSQIEVAPVPGVGMAKSLVLVTLPEWLATDKGLV
jgi:hypothetical protein